MNLKNLQLIGFKTWRL